MELKYDSRINGEFNGWDGDTIFKLSNGTTWQQKRYEYKYVYKYCPKVKIWEDSCKYFLEVDGVNKMLEVKRVY